MSRQSSTAFLWLIAALALVPVASSAQESDKKRPNILFIMADDHGYQAISAYGSQMNKTPHIDRLAKEGMRFDRCFVTNSICGPSRAVILTGKYNHLNGFIDNNSKFNGAQPHVARYLKAAGYQTAVIGKWHLVSDPTGFDHWEILQGQGPYYNPPLKTAKGVVKHEGYTTEIIAERTVDWLKNHRDQDKPFFLMCHHKATHREWVPGPKQIDHYKDATIPEPETLFDDYSGRSPAAKNQQMTVARHLDKLDLKFDLPKNLTPSQRELLVKAYAEENAAYEEEKPQGKEDVRWKFQRYAKDYLRCVDALDDAVGRVLTTLDELGLTENTLVVYTSDQGWYLGEHGWYDKRWMYEESFRTPCIIRWPGHTKPGTVDQHLVMNLDFAETFLDAAGVKVPDDMQGRSLTPILEGKPPADWRKDVYYHYYEFPQPHHVEPHYGVRSERYKLIYFNRIDAWELFDLEEDPRELQSVYDDPAYAAIVKQLKQRLIELRKQYKDDDAKQVAMTEPADLIAMYAQLARVAGMRGRLYVQDKLLLCAGLIAAQVDLPKTAAHCRERILQHNPQHWLGKFATIADAIADDDSLGLIRQTQRHYPPERTEQLYSTLGLTLEEERARHLSSAAFLAAALGTSLFDLDEA